jgi:hypothetical protein
MSSSKSRATVDPASSSENRGDHGFDIPVRSLLETEVGKNGDKGWWSSGR